MGRERNLIALAVYFLLGGGLLLWAFNSTTALRDHSSMAWRELQRQTKVSAGLSTPGKKSTPAKPLSAKAKVKTAAKPAPKQQAPPVPSVMPSAPADQEISINLICAGVAPGSNKVDFDFRALWGEWKNTRQTMELASFQSGTSKLDLEFAKLHVSPKFVSGTKGKYTVKVQSKNGGTMGQFDITDSGKPVKLVAASTPGYTQRLVFFDQERRLSAYRIQKTGGGRVSDAMGVLFVGQGWNSVELGKAKVQGGGPEFPKIDMVILPKEWMDTKDITQTMRTLKRGEVVNGGAGVCYS
jgi:hypothetical protein